MEIFFIPQRKRKKRKKIQRFFKIENCQEEEKLRFEFFQFNIRSSKHRKKERKKKKRRRRTIDNFYPRFRRVLFSIHGWIATENLTDFVGVGGVDSSG